MNKIKLRVKVPCSVYCTSDSESDRLIEQKLGNIKSSSKEALISIISIFCSLVSRKSNHLPHLKGGWLSLHFTISLLLSHYYINKGVSHLPSAASRYILL